MDENGELQVSAIIGGKYRIDRVLGQGGMGIVYAATHIGLEQRVALKFLLRAAAEHPQMVERFAREARAAVRIQSEHVARVLDVGTVASGIPYIVMEYLEGDAIDELLRREGRLSVQVAVDSILQACQALAEAHSLGIVHRDIKPANLFRARRPGRSLVKVLDFGICKVPLTVEKMAITGEAAMMGSPGYMSPEQFYGAAAVDVRSDVWGLGAVLYEMLGGRPPFLADSMAALIAQVLHVPHPPLASVTTEVPPALAAVIDACLEKEPALRPSNVAVLAGALAPFGPPGSTDRAASIAEVLGLAPPAFGASAASGGLVAQGTARTVSSPSYGSSGGNFAGRPPQVKETTLAPMTAPPSVRSTWRATVIVVASIATVFILGGAGLGLVLSRPKLHTGIVAQPAESSARLAGSAAPLPSAPTASVAAPSSSAAPPASVAANDAPAESAKPASAGLRPHAKPHASASAAASAVAPPEPPKCHLAASLDEQGNQHFVRVCE